MKQVRQTLEEKEATLDIRRNQLLDNVHLVKALGQCIEHDAFYVYNSRNGGYSHINISDRIEKYHRKDNKTNQIINGKYKVWGYDQLNRLIKNNLGDKPLFFQNRESKIGNVISRVKSPRVRIYDFDNKEHIPQLADKLNDIACALDGRFDTLIGIRPDFYGLHVNCIIGSEGEKIVNQFMDEYNCLFFKLSRLCRPQGGVDIFDADKDGAVGIAGFDHYNYNGYDVMRFVYQLGITPLEALVKHKVFSQEMLDNFNKNTKPYVDKYMTIDSDTGLYGNANLDDEIGSVKLSMSDIEGIVPINVPSGKTSLKATGSIRELGSFVDGNRAKYLLGKPGTYYLLSIVKQNNLNDVESISSFIESTTGVTLEKDHKNIIKTKLKHFKNIGSINLESSNERLGGEDYIYSHLDKWQRNKVDSIAKKSPVRRNIMALIYSTRGFSNKFITPDLYREWFGDIAKETFYKEYKYIKTKFNFTMSESIFLGKGRRGNKTQEILDYGYLKEIDRRAFKTDKDKQNEKNLRQINNSKFKLVSMNISFDTSASFLPPSRYYMSVSRNMAESKNNIKAKRLMSIEKSKWQENLNNSVDYGLKITSLKYLGGRGLLSSNSYQL
ncbi:MAG: hypothetical protein FWG80_01835 [Alphaproteobacteria bacterium]|nr:hypothetical protein [Alphaproteobacteria bacterium]